jgi:hypothetical protein
MLIDGFNFNGTISDGEYCVEVTRSTATGVNDWAKEGSMPFPNPTTGLLNLGSASYESVEIYDHSGRLLRTYQLPGNSIDLGSFKSGLYLIKGYSSGGVHVARIIKE